MVRDRGGYQSFSVLGMAVILAIGSLIIFVGLIVDTVVGWLRPQKSMFMKEQWELEDTLALHRAAYTAHGHDLAEGKLPPSTIFVRGVATTSENEEQGVVVGKSEYTEVPKAA
jgi:hypothetical protein